MFARTSRSTHSDADLARHIRLLIRDRIAKGERNDQLRDDLVQPYGVFILLKPPLKKETLLLWLSAPLSLVFGGLAIAGAYRRPAAEAAALAPEKKSNWGRWY